MKTPTRVILAIIGFILFQVGLIGGAYCQEFQTTSGKIWIAVVGLIDGLILCCLGGYLVVSSISGKFLKP